MLAATLGTTRGSAPYVQQTDDGFRPWWEKQIKIKMSSLGRRVRIAELLRSREVQIASVRATISPKVLVKQLHFVGQNAANPVRGSLSWTNPCAEVGVPLKVTGTVIVLPMGGGASSAPAIVDVDPAQQIVRWVRVADGRLVCSGQLHYVPSIGDIGSAIRVDVFVRVAGASVEAEDPETDILRSSVAVASATTQPVTLTALDLKQAVECLRSKRPAAFELVDWPEKDAPGTPSTRRGSPSKRGGGPSATIVLTREKLKYQLNGRTSGNKLVYGRQVELSEVAGHANKARVRLGKKEFEVTFGSSRSRTTAIITFAAFSGRARNEAIAASAADAKVLAAMSEAQSRALVGSLLAIDGELSYKRARVGASSAPQLPPVTTATQWSTDADDTELATALDELRLLAREIGDDFPPEAVELVSRLLPALQKSYAARAGSYSESVGAKASAYAAPAGVGGDAGVGRSSGTGASLAARFSAGAEVEATATAPATPIRAQQPAAAAAVVVVEEEDDDDWGDDVSAAAGVPAIDGDGAEWGDVSVTAAQPSDADAALQSVDATSPRKDGGFAKEEEEEGNGFGDDDWGAAPAGGAAATAAVGEPKAFGEDDWGTTSTAAANSNDAAKPDADADGFGDDAWGATTPAGGGDAEPEAFGDDDWGAAAPTAAISDDAAVAEPDAFGEDDWGATPVADADAEAAVAADGFGDNDEWGATAADDDAQAAVAEPDAFGEDDWGATPAADVDAVATVAVDGFGDDDGWGEPCADDDVEEPAAASVAGDAFGEDDWGATPASSIDTAAAEADGFGEDDWSATTPSQASDTDTAAAVEVDGFDADDWGAAASSSTTAGAAAAGEFDDEAWGDSDDASSGPSTRMETMEPSSSSSFSAGDAILQNLPPPPPMVDSDDDEDDDVEAYSRPDAHVISSPLSHTAASPHVVVASPVRDVQPAYNAAQPWLNVDGMEDSSDDEDDEDAIESRGASVSSMSGGSTGVPSPSRKNGEGSNSTAAEEDIAGPFSLPKSDRDRSPKRSAAETQRNVQVAADDGDDERAAAATVAPGTRGAAIIPHAWDELIPLRHVRGRSLRALGITNGSVIVMRIADDGEGADTGAAKDRFSATLAAATKAATTRSQNERASELASKSSEVAAVAMESDVAASEEKTSISAEVDAAVAVSGGDEWRDDAFEDLPPAAAAAATSETTASGSDAAWDLDAFADDSPASTSTLEGGGGGESEFGAGEENGFGVGDDDDDDWGGDGFAPLAEEEHGGGADGDGGGDADAWGLESDAFDAAPADAWGGGDTFGDDGPSNAAAATVSAGAGDDGFGGEGDPFATPVAGDTGAAAAVEEEGVAFAASSGFDDDAVVEDAFGGDGDPFAVPAFASSGVGADGFDDFGGGASEPFPEADNAVVDDGFGGDDDPFATPASSGAGTDGFDDFDDFGGGASDPFAAAPAPAATAAAAASSGEFGEGGDLGFENDGSAAAFGEFDNADALGSIDDAWDDDAFGVEESFGAATSAMEEGGDAASTAAADAAVAAAQAAVTQAVALCSGADTAVAAAVAAAVAQARQAQATADASTAAAAVAVAAASAAASVAKDAADAVDRERQVVAARVLQESARARAQVRVAKGELATRRRAVRQKEVEAARDAQREEYRRRQAAMAQVELLAELKQVLDSVEQRLKITGQKVRSSSLFSTHMQFITVHCFFPSRIARLVRAAILPLFPPSSSCFSVLQLRSVPANVVFTSVMLESLSGRLRLLRSEMESGMSRCLANMPDTPMVPLEKSNAEAAAGARQRSQRYASIIGRMESSAQQRAGASRGNAGMNVGAPAATSSAAPYVSLLQRMGMEKRDDVALTTTSPSLSVLPPPLCFSHPLI